MQMLGYTFDQAREFIDVVRGKWDADDCSQLTLIMSDRTAQRDFPAEPSAEEGAARSLDPALLLLSRQLHALAALGGPGSGLVGVGPALGSLHGLGLGNDKDLADCLTACGVDREGVEAVAFALRNGGILAFVSEEPQRELLKERGRELAFELPESAHGVSSPVTAPAAPVSDQRPNYNPIFMPTDVTDRNR